MAGVASLAFMMMDAAGVRAESVSVLGANGANAVDGVPGVPATGGDSVTATAGSIQPVTDPGNSAFATGGNGGDGGNNPNNIAGEPGGGATATAATTVISGSAEADATAIGGNGGNAGPGFGFSNSDGGGAGASSTAVTSGSGDASSSANATGGAEGYGDYGFAGGASAVADATAAGGGKATAVALATAGRSQLITFPSNSAYATSNAETVNGAMADAQSRAIAGPAYPPAPGQASSTAKTTFAGARVESTTTAPTDGNAVVASTHAIAQGGSGQAFANPGESAYAFSSGLPDKAYATTLIDGASNVASALLGPRDAVFGTAMLGANYAPNEIDVISTYTPASTYSATSTFDFAYGGDLLLGLIDDQVSGFAGGQGFQSMEFTIAANGVEIFDVTFLSLAAAESFFNDDIIDLGSDLGPNIDLTVGYTLVADGSDNPGGFGFDLALGGAVPEPSTWAMMLVGFAGLGFAGYRSTGRGAVAGLRA